MNRSLVTVALGAIVACFGAVPAWAGELDVEVSGAVNVASPGLVAISVDGDATLLRVGSVEPVRAAGSVAHFDKQELSAALADGALTVTSGAARETVSVETEAVFEVRTTDPGALEALGAVEPLVPGSVNVSKLLARARASAPDMRDWYRLTLPASTDVDAALARVRAVDGVSSAEPAPDLAPPPQMPDTPDFTAMQGYLRDSALGIHADFSRKDPRARGAGVKIADLEYYWTAAHEDLQLNDAVADLGKTQFPQYTGFADEHGTAVFGEMVGKDNGYGVTGGVPDASMHGISPTMRRASGNGTSYNTAAALTYVAQFLSPGDVVLVEQQTPGPAGGEAYVPIEWTQANFDAIKMLSSLGIIVMETGGNGGQNLDGTNMLGRFDRAVRDSGAIIGGAGSSTNLSALTFSSYGNRVDLQGWGQNITSTGSGGNLFGGTAPAMVTRRYTRSFSGTSGAGPIVVSAIVAVQSYLKATGQGVYTSAQMRDLLRRTGTAQTGTRLVGPLPNVEAALKEVEVDAPTSSASLSPSGVNGWYLNPSITLTADDGWGVGADKTEYRLDGGAWTPYTTPVQVTAPGAHKIEYRSTDKKGNVEAVKSTEFNVYDLDTDTPGSGGGTVPATLALTLGTAASFGPFTPGVAKEYTAASSANVISTAGDAALTVSDPGRLTNGAFSLPQPLRVEFSKSTWTGPVSNDPVTITFKQAVGANDALRTGTYSKTLTFTLSTTNP